jgi:hypothetical protein
MVAIRTSLRDRVLDVVHVERGDRDRMTSMKATIEHE